MQWKITHLLFMTDLMLHSISEKELNSFLRKVHVFSKDIGMSLGIGKCAMLIMKKDMIVMTWLLV